MCSSEWESRLLVILVPPDASKEQLEKAKADAEDRDKRRRVHTLESVDPERVRYCPACDAYKPPRAHHCRDCKRCVLRMDHHCPWVNNCVGHANHKYFLQFLTYSSVGLTYQLISVIARLVVGLQSPNRMAGIAGMGFEVADIILMFLNFFLALPVTIAIISLYVYQLSCVVENQTSVEDYICRRARKIARRQGIKSFKWPYDFGFAHNVKSIYGSQWLGWILPYFTTDGDGMHFKVRNMVQTDNHSDSEIDVVIRKDDSTHKRHGNHGAIGLGPSKLH